jgi:hypothetical protein
LLPPDPLQKVVSPGNVRGMVTVAKRIAWLYNSGAADATHLTRSPINPFGGSGGVRTPDWGERGASPRLLRSSPAVTARNPEFPELSFART